MKKFFIILLALCFAAGICSCKKAEKPGSQTNTSDKKQPTVTAKGVSNMTPIIEGLIYAGKLGDYSAKDEKYVWSAFAYILSNYGYGTLGGGSSSGTADTGLGITIKQQIMTTADAEKLMHACFGNDAKLPKEGFDEYFTEADGIYTLKGEIASEKLNISIERVSSSSGKATVNLLSSEESKERSYSVYFKQSTDESSPYPVNITGIEENPFG